MCISYIGGKSKISKFIIPYYPKDIETYVECFGGMMWCYFKMDLRFYPNLKNVIYNDINPLNSNFFRCLKESPETLYQEMLKYPTQKLGEDIDPIEYIETFNRCQKEVFDPNFIVDNKPNYDTAAKYLYVLTHIFSGGKPATSKFIYYHGKYRDKYLVFMDKLKKKEWLDHFKRISVVENLDFCEAIKKYDTDKTLIYIDAPYYNCETYYSNHDFGLKDHQRLSECLKDVKSKFAMSYYEFPQLQEWFPKNDFRWESKEFPKSAAARKDIQQTQGREILIMNYNLTKDEKKEENLVII